MTILKVLQNREGTTLNYGQKHEEGISTKSYLMLPNREKHTLQ